MKHSIITINYNNLDGLKKTMESVFAQTCKDFEYIVIDGASTDGSAEYIKENADKLDYWVSEKDTGIYNAMNKGILASKGEYLLMLNSGDYLVDENVIENIYPDLSNYDIICGQCRVSQNGKILYTTNVPQSISLWQMTGSGIPHQSTFVKKELLVKLGLYDETYKYIADWKFFVVALITNSSSFMSIPLIVSDYNIDGLSSQKDNKKLINKELTRIWEETKLNRVVCDYYNFHKKESQYQIMEWCWNKSYIRQSLLLIYKLSKHINKHVIHE